jgi:hypothetical protein
MYLTIAVALDRDAHPETLDSASNLTNSLLLRADIRSLLDLQSLAIEPGSRTVIASSLLDGTQYEALSGHPGRRTGRRMAAPKSRCP